MTPLLSLHNVTKTFHDPGQQSLGAVKNVTLTIKRGEFFILLGPSGCGKSTLLRMMAGFEKNFEGSLVRSPDVKAEDMSYVFQQFALFPWLTVFQNVELPLIAHGVPVRERETRVRTELKRLGLSRFAASAPKDLSGGMRQRVGIARALVTEPKVIFMDEPFSELDSFTAQELRQEMLDVWKDVGVTIVMVTHLISEAVQMADRIAVMTARPGMIKKLIVNRLPRPRQLRAPEFFALEDKLDGLVKH